MEGEQRWRDGIGKDWKHKEEHCSERYMGEDGWQRNKEQSLIIEPVEEEVVGKRAVGTRVNVWEGMTQGGRGEN